MKVFNYLKMDISLYDITEEQLDELDPEMFKSIYSIYAYVDFLCVSDNRYLQVLNRGINDKMRAINKYITKSFTPYKLDMESIIIVLCSLEEISKHYDIITTYAVYCVFACEYFNTYHVNSLSELFEFKLNLT